MVDSKYYVMYNSSEAIWCFQDEMFEKLALGWVLHAYTNNEAAADKLVEECCYLPL
jgi:hypothetical protein